MLNNLKIAHINLKDNNIKFLSYSEKVARDYIGGRVLGLYTFVKEIGMDEQLAYIGKRNKGKPISRIVAANLNALEWAEEDRDALFLTKAAEFLIKYTDKFYTEECRANYNLFKSILEGKQEEKKETKVKFSL